MEENVKLANMIKKLRRRLIAFFQDPKTKEHIIVKVSKICGIKIPDEVKRKYGSEP